MSDRDPIWDAMKQISRERFDADRKRNMAEAAAHDDGGWTKHTEFHWSRMVAGRKLDYWPSTRKFQYMGKVSRRDVIAFIKLKEAPKPTAAQKARP